MTKFPTIGILGGGQLAQMLAIDGYPLGFRFVFFEIRFTTKFLFVFRVLEEPEMYFNDNIQGKFFRKDFDI